DGGAFFVFAADPSSVFTSGVSFTLIANFADGTSASASASVLMPTISSVSPSTGVQGANLTVTVTGTNFQAGASAAFGAGITVTSTTMVRSHHLSPVTAPGPTPASAARNETVSNPDGQSVVLIPLPTGFGILHLCQLHAAHELRTLSLHDALPI